MTWFRLDDQGAFHAKVLAAGNEAYGAWCRAGQWSSAHGTDGEIPRHVASQIAPPRVWRRLISVKLLDEIRSENDPFFIHDFLDYNPSRASVDERRRVRAANGALGGKRRVLNESAKQTLDQEPSNHSSKEQVVATGLLEPCSNPRPVPARPGPNPEREPPSSPPRGASEANLGLDFGQPGPASATTIPATAVACPETLPPVAVALPVELPTPPPKGSRKPAKKQVRKFTDEQIAARDEVYAFWKKTYFDEFNVEPIVGNAEVGQMVQLLKKVNWDSVLVCALITNAFADVYFREKIRTIGYIAANPSAYQTARVEKVRVSSGQIEPGANFFEQQDERLREEFG